MGMERSGPKGRFSEVREDSMMVMSDEEDE